MPKFLLALIFGIITSGMGGIGIYSITTNPQSVSAISYIVSAVMLFLSITCAVVMAKELSS